MGGWKKRFTRTPTAFHHAGVPNRAAATRERIFHVGGGVVLNVPTRRGAGVVGAFFLCPSSVLCVVVEKKLGEGSGRSRSGFSGGVLPVFQR